MITILEECLQEIINNEQLKEIDLSNKALNSSQINEFLTALALPRNQATAERIIELDLSNNELTDVPDLRALINLEELRLSSNNLKKVVLHNCLEKLKLLKLDDNPIDELFISDEIMVNLDFLNLAATNRNMFALPPGPLKMEYLILSENNLTEFEMLETLLDNLEELDLSDNYLTKLEMPKILNNKLKELNLSDNQFTTIDIPAEYSALDRVDLSNNQLTMATKLALNAEAVERQKPFAIYDRHPPLGTKLDNSILGRHFLPMLRANENDALNYFNNTGATSLLFFRRNIPLPLLWKISEYVATPSEMVRARSSIAYFQRIFKGECKSALDAYVKEFDQLIDDDKKYYQTALEDIQKRAAPQASNQPAASQSASVGTRPKRLQQ